MCGLPTSGLLDVQISPDLLWTLLAVAQCIVNVCVWYSDPQTHHRGLALFGISSLLYLNM